MHTNQAPKFTTERGTFAQGGSGRSFVLASEGYADLLVQRDNTLGGYSVFRRGDDDVVSNHRSQAEAKAAAVEAWKIDQA